jgi:hypothetical protein
MLQMTVTARATMVQTNLKGIRIEAAIVSQQSTMWRLVMRKFPNDADNIPAGILLLGHRDGSPKERDCDPRMGLVRILR